MRRLAAAAVGLAVATAACGSDADTTVPGGSGGDLVVSGEVVVFAAASLTDAFTELGDAFVAANPDASIVFNFAASSELVAQIVEGAPADVYASADLDDMARLTDAGAGAGDPVVFAGNRLEIVVGPGNPLGIGGVEDLADDDLILVLCSPTVPCGRYAAQVFERAGVAPAPASYEANVRSVLTKVTLGEADAGIVYVTDVLAAGDDAQGVGISVDLDVAAEYPIAVTAEAPNPDGARAFVDLVLGDTGRQILAAYGFSSP